MKYSYDIMKIRFLYQLDRYSIIKIYLYKILYFLVINLELILKKAWYLYTTSLQNIFNIYTYTLIM